MSYSARVFQAMKFDRIYAPEDLQAITSMEQKDVNNVLNLLVKGGGSRENPSRQICEKPAL